jgi:hypothetical protein
MSPRRDSHRSVVDALTPTSCRRARSARGGPSTPSWAGTTKARRPHRRAGRPGLRRTTDGLTTA